MDTHNNLADDAPFVNEECGDTMWDETLLNQLTESTACQQTTHFSTTLEAMKKEEIHTQGNLKAPLGCS